MTKRIAILWHKNERETTQRYDIIHNIKLWQDDGIDVVHVFGTKHFIPADLAILHVDLSIVPDEYLEFAQQYPIVLNGKVKDIRKSTFSNHILHRDDSYEGKVIIKSDLNYAGKPERNMQNSFIAMMIRRIGLKLDKSGLRGHSPGVHFDSPSDYLILDSPNQIHREWFEMKDIVIEKFLPEINNGYYCIRNYFFLGNNSHCILRKATHPIVNSRSTISIEPVDVHPEIVAIRKKLYFDYGKFDYVVHENVPVLLDINKTIGSSTPPSDPDYLARRRAFASGIRYYLS